MKNRALWKQVLKNSFTYYSQLNFKHTGDPDDLVEFQQKSIADAISEQDIPAAEQLDVYLELCRRFPDASASTKRKWRTRIANSSKNLRP